MGVLVLSSRSLISQCTHTQVDMFIHKLLVQIASIVLAKSTQIQDLAKPRLLSAPLMKVIS